MIEALSFNSVSLSWACWGVDTILVIYLIATIIIDFVDMMVERRIKAEEIFLDLEGRKFNLARTLDSYNNRQRQQNIGKPAPGYNQPSQSGNIYPLDK